MSVADFHRDVMAALAELDIAVSIYTRPVEVAEAIPFERDRKHASYDTEAINRIWRAFAQADRVFKVFRARFQGKSSPSHFFWGARSEEHTSELQSLMRTSSAVFCLKKK